MKNLDFATFFDANVFFVTKKFSCTLPPPLTSNCFYILSSKKNAYSCYKKAIVI